MDDRELAAELAVRALEEVRSQLRGLPTAATRERATQRAERCFRLVDLVHNVPSWLVGKWHVDDPLQALLSFTRHPTNIAWLRGQLCSLGRADLAADLPTPVDDFSTPGSFRPRIEQASAS